MINCPLTFQSYQIKKEDTITLLKDCLHIHTGEFVDKEKIIRGIMETIDDWKRMMRYGKQKEDIDECTFLTLYSSKVGF